MFETVPIPEPEVPEGCILFDFLEGPFHGMQYYVDIDEDDYLNMSQITSFIGIHTITLMAHMCGMDIN